MATCCRQLCPWITSCSGWPVLGHGERNALSSPLTFRSLYFLHGFHSDKSNWLEKEGNATEPVCVQDEEKRVGWGGGGFGRSLRQGGARDDERQHTGTTHSLRTPQTRRNTQSQNHSSPSSHPRKKKNLWEIWQNTKELSQQSDKEQQAKRRIAFWAQSQKCWSVKNILVVQHSLDKIISSSPFVLWRIS